MSDRELLYLEYMEAMCQWETFRNDFEDCLNSVQQCALDRYDSLMTRRERAFALLDIEQKGHLGSEFIHLSDLIHPYEDEDSATEWTRIDTLKRYVEYEQ